MGFWRMSIPGRKNSKCKGPEANVSLLCSRSPVWLEERDRGVEWYEVSSERKRGRGQTVWGAGCYFLTLA